MFIYTWQKWNPPGPPHVTSPRPTPCDIPQAHPMTELASPDPPHDRSGVPQTRLMTEVASHANLMTEVASPRPTSWQKWRPHAHLMADVTSPRRTSWAMWYPPCPPHDRSGVPMPTSWQKWRPPDPPHGRCGVPHANLMTEVASPPMPTSWQKWRPPCPPHDRSAPPCPPHDRSGAPHAHLMTEVPPPPPGPPHDRSGAPMPTSWCANSCSAAISSAHPFDFRDHCVCKPAPSSDGAGVRTSRPCWSTSLLSGWRGWPPPPYPHTQSASGKLRIPTACFGDRWSPRWLQITHLVYFSPQTSLHFLLLFLSDPPPVLSVFNNPGHGHQL